MKPGKVIVRAAVILGAWFFALFLSTIVYHFIYAPIVVASSRTASVSSQPLSIYLPAGMGIEYLADELYQRGYVKNRYIFIALAYLLGQTRELKTGEYEISSNLTIYQLLHHIVSGTVMYRSVTFIEGWTFQQWKEALIHNPYIEHTILHLGDRLLMLKLTGVAQLPEGWFFPDTYFFIRGDTDENILKRAYEKMRLFIDEAWPKRDAKLADMSAYQILKVASLLEKETAISEERVKIAGVIFNRLRKPMLLQVDPTVLYGSNYDGPIRKEDLMRNNPYNTYKNYGLPPTPINMPSKSSVLAALHPVWSTAYYYVACGHGHHIFSNTYKAHVRAIEHCLYPETLTVDTAWIHQLLPWRDVSPIPWSVSHP